MQICLPCTSAPLPLHAKRPTAVADAGLSLAVINSTHICAAHKPRSFPAATPPFLFLPNVVQHTRLTDSADRTISVFYAKLEPLLISTAHEQPRVGGGGQRKYFKAAVFDFFK